MSVPIELRFEVEDVYNEYAAVLDDGPLDRWPALFMDPCDYRIIPRENYEDGYSLAIMRCDSRGMLQDRVVAVQELLMYEPRYLRHLISNIRIREVSADGSRIDAIANYAVLETLRDEFTRVLNSGRYFDQIERDQDGVLRFRKKLCVYDSELIPNSIVYPI